MDWRKLISELEAAGLSQAEIAEAVGCSQPYVSQLKNGQRKGCDYLIGRALVALHKKKHKSAA